MLVSFFMRYLSSRIYHSITIKILYLIQLLFYTNHIIITYTHMKYALGLLFYEIYQFLKPLCTIILFSVTPDLIRSLLLVLVLFFIVPSLV